MAQNIKDEKIENIIKETIIPDLEKLLSKEYESDLEILNALDELEISWKNLHIPNEYDTSFDMLVNDKCSKEDIYGILPYSHIYIYVMKPLIIFSIFSSLIFCAIKLSSLKY